VRDFVRGSENFGSVSTQNPTTEDDSRRAPETKPYHGTGLENFPFHLFESAFSIEMPENFNLAVMPDNLQYYRLLMRSSLVLLLSSGVTMESGCGSLSNYSRKEQVRAELHDNPKYSIGSIQGPTERGLARTNWERKRAELLKEGDDATSRALANFDAAQVLYDEEKFAEAEKAFKGIVKERRDLHENFFAKVRRAWGAQTHDDGDLYSTYGDAIEEDALFMVAESQYAQRKFPDAEKSYQDLLVKYPSTRYLDPTTRKLFKIARYWLDFPEDVGSTGDVEVKVANHETKELGKLEKPVKAPPVSSRVPVLPNVTDPSRPLFDTYGRGKQALRAIWLHDATGPLADDALMLAANHNLRTGDYVEAARLYTLLREQYPDSKHLKDAYLLGSHVTLASYMGPAYDGKTLETSRELKEQMLALFPDLTQEQRKQLEAEVDRLREAEVARLWNLVEFYKVKRMNPAVKLHCYLIINRHADSKYAELAREELLRVDEREQAWENSIWNFNRKSPPVPQVSPTPAPAEENKPARVALPESSPLQEPPPFSEPPKKLGPLQRLNPLRRPDVPPNLQPIERDPRSSDPKPLDAVPSDAVPNEPPLRASYEKQET